MGTGRQISALEMSGSDKAVIAAMMAGSGALKANQQDADKIGDVMDDIAEQVRRPAASLSFSSPRAAAARRWTWPTKCRPRWPTPRLPTATLTWWAVPLRLLRPDGEFMWSFC